MSIGFCRAAPLAVMALFGLTACHPDQVQPITAADESWVNDVHVAAIYVESGGPDIPAEVMDNLSRHLRSVMDECVSGQRPIDLRVQIKNFDDNSAGAAILVGDTIGVSGSVLIEDPQTGDIKGVYYVTTLRSGGGIIGAIVLSGAEDTMPEAFAERLCEEVFSGTAPGQEAGAVPDAENDLPTDAWGTSVDEVGAAGTSTSSIYQAPVLYNPETE